MKEQGVFDFQQAIEQIREKYHFDFVGIAMVQAPELRFEIRWVYVTGNRSERYKRIVLQSGKGIAGIVFKTGKPLLVEDADQKISKQDIFNYPIVVAEGLKSFGAVPLLKGNRVKGVLLAGFRLENELTDHIFTTFKHEVGAGFGPFNR